MLACSSEALHVHALVCITTFMNAYCSLILCMQILFPASYSETAAWLRKAAISNEGTLRQCISQLQAALGANMHLQTLITGVEVRPSPRCTANCCAPLRYNHAM
jgi:hypothetical protein